MMKRITGFAALSLAAALSIAPVQSASADMLGGIIGAATGGILGNQVGKGTGKVVATAAGAAIGYGVGDYLSSERSDMPRQVTRVREYEPQRRGHYGYSEPRTVVYKTTVIQPQRVIYKRAEPEVVIIKRDRPYKIKKVVHKTTTVVRRGYW